MLISVAEGCCNEEEVTRIFTQAMDHYEGLSHSLKLITKGTACMSQIPV